MKFRYKNYGAEVERPVIPIRVTHNGRRIGYEALVDSGADSCIFHAEVGEALGLDIAAGRRQEVGGITGVREPYYIHRVTIDIGGYEHEIEAGFLPGLANVRYGVLGQRGFFDLYIVKFDLLKKEIELRASSI